MRWSAQWQTLNSEQPTKRHYILALCWLMGVVFSGYYYSAQRLVEFDPKEKLTHVIPEQLGKQISALLEEEVRNSKGRVVHFIDQDCRCNVYSEPHVAKVSELASQVDFDVTMISSTDKLPDFITATPATLVLGKNNELVYLGPYAQGAFCNQATDVVGLVLENYQKGFNAQLINNQAKGCYCVRT